MTIDKDDHNRLKEIQAEMLELLDEFKDICRRAMGRDEYQRFKYRTLAHIEPGLSEESDWVPDMGIDSLEKVIDNTLVNNDEEDESESEEEDE